MTYGTDAWTALSDPMRRTIVERLLVGALPVSKLAEGLPVSRPAVSQHLKVLKAAGLVTDRAEGTRRYYRLDPSGLSGIRGWLDRFWATSLEAFKSEVEKTGNPLQ